jgi:toxin secretion/phage lysis holin
MNNFFAWMANAFSGDSGKVVAAKGIVGVATGVLLYASGWVGNIWWCLLILMGLDYLTGVIGAWVNKCLSSEVGWKGIVRKFGIIVLTAVCMLVDYAIASLSSGAGFTFPLQGMVTILVCCWLIGNELLSILENLGKMGVPFPGFLKKLFSRFQNAAETAAGADKPGEGL